MAGHYVRQLLDALFELQHRLLRVGIQGDVDEGKEAKPQGVLVQGGVIANDDLFLQALQPLPAGGWRQVDPGCHLRVGQPAIDLKNLQDRAIDAVQFCHALSSR
ncbi:hypothetical protein FQZ97_724090 [compost metagenome]